MPLETPAVAGVATSTCTHTGALHALVPEWRDLWQRSSRAVPFTAPGWQLAWWHHFGRGGLWTMAFRDHAGRLIGLAPLYINRENGIRTVRLIGAGLSDYLDLLAEEPWRDAVLNALGDELDAHPERWDVAEFQQLPRDSALLQTDGAHGDQTVAADACPVLTLGPAVDRAEPAAAEAHASEGLRAHLAQDRRRLERAFGAVTVEMATSATLAELLDDLRRLHGARWNARGKPGVLLDEPVWRFHREAAAALFAGGLVRLYALRAGGAVRAVYYGFQCRDRAYYYLGGFDPECAPFGIGNQMVAQAIAAARDEGARSFDFLRGQEPYKYRWGARDTTTFNRRLYRDAVLRRGAPDIFHPRVDSSDSAVRSVA